MKKILLSLIIALIICNVVNAQLNPDEDFQIKFDKFLQNQKTPFLKANSEVFVLDGIVWERQYGEYEYVLMPVTKNISEYNAKICRMDNKIKGIIKSKHHFVKVAITPLSKSLLKNMNITIPGYVQNNVLVFLPEINIEELANNNIAFTIVNDYGKKTGQIEKGKEIMTSLFSEGFEVSSVPSADYTSTIGVANCGWTDVYCNYHGGSFSAWCAGNGAACNSCGSDYVSNINSELSKVNAINTSQYQDLIFTFWMSYNFNDLESTDYLAMYYWLGSSWVLSSTIYDSNSPNDNAGWFQYSVSYAGINQNYSFDFLFHSDGSWTSTGVYIDDIALTGTSALPANAGTISGSATVCQGQTNVTYNVPTISQATSYIWTLPSGAIGSSSTNSISVSFNNNAASGSITVKGSNSVGTGASSSKSITVNPLPAAAGAISGTSTVCQNQTAITYTIPSISNATSYVWSLPSGASGSSSSNSISVNFGSSASSGVITVSGSNSCGNSTQSSFAVTVNPIPPTPTISQNGNQLVSNATNGNQWYVDNWSLINGATNQTYTPQNIGNYFVVVSLNGCNSSMSNTINFTDVEEITANSNFSVYPNPVTQNIYIEILKSHVKLKFEIFNSIGQMVYSSIIDRRAVIDVSHFANGVYDLNIYEDNNIFTKRLIKE